MGIISKIGRQKRVLGVHRASTAPHDTLLSHRAECTQHDLRLYDVLRQNIPIIDAALNMSVRLCGGVRLESNSAAANSVLRSLCDTVRVLGQGMGIESFLATYLDTLLCYGNAVAEVVPTGTGEIALYNADLKNLEIAEKDGGTGVTVFVRENNGVRRVSYPELLLFTSLSAPAGHSLGTSLLRGLPFVSGILLNIYDTIGKNWEHAGNVRYAVTYKPSGDPLDRAYAKERAESIAEEWGRAMNDSNGDFIAVGDVNVSVIGAESAIPSSEIPVRQLLEQIVSKLGVPPYILGLSWSSTERMSGEQADIFTSLLTFYRRTVTPALQKIGTLALAYAGVPGDVTVEWDDINLRDALYEAQARYYNARAEIKG